MARYIYCFCLQCFDHLLCELDFFSCDGDATHKLQRQVDGWMVPLKSQPVAYYRESRSI